MKEKRTKIVLLHILEDLQDIQHFIEGISKEEFKTNSLVKKAICMSLLNIGEMSRELPEALTKRNPDVPWNSVIGLRNRTAHGYHSLDDDIIWDIANNDLSSFKDVVLRELQEINKTLK